MAIKNPTSVSSITRLGRDGVTIIMARWLTLRLSDDRLIQELNMTPEVLMVLTLNYDRLRRAVNRPGIHPLAASGQLGPRSAHLTGPEHQAIEQRVGRLNLGFGRRKVAVTI
jgi:hypothetical protein